MSQVVKRGHSMLALVLVFLLMVCSAAIAQVINGSITGEVRDASGAVIPKAKVTVTDPSIGVKEAKTTDSRGVFYFASLPKGTYSVTVSTDGFKSLDKTDVYLSNGDHLNLGALTLTVGAAQETVTVEADAGQLQIQSESGERSDTITTRQIDNLGMNGSMVLDYLKVIPGVNSTYNGVESQKGGLGNISVNGGRGGMTGFLIDGINNVDNGCNCATQVTINPDSIAEVKVLTSNYAAEYGKTAAGQISITTKGGENRFHGNLRYEGRTTALDATQWFDGQANVMAKQANPNAAEPNPKQTIKYNYFGGAIGGPVIIPGTNFNRHRDKLFFYFNEEVYQQYLPGGYSQVYMPTAAEIGGDFSKSTNGNGQPVVVKDPTTGLPYPGNIITSGINTQMQQALLKVYPRPIAADADPATNCSWSDGTTGHQCNRYNYVTNLSTTHPRREDIARVDYQVNTGNRAYFSWLNNPGSEFLPEGESPQGISNFEYPGGMRLKEPSYTTVGHLTSTLSPTMVNEFSLGWSVNHQHIYSTDNNVFSSKYNLGIPTVYPVAANSPIPDFGFGGMTNQDGTWSYLGALPWANALTVINLNDSLSKMIGKHIVKAGILIERSRKDQSSWGNANGSFSFTTGAASLPTNLDTGDTYANALLGNYSSFQQQDGRPRGFYRYNNIEFYLQDTFKLTSRLTLDYGMRFAWVQPQYDAKMQVSYFDPTAWDPSQAVHLYKPTPADGGASGYDPATGNKVAQNMIGLIVPGSGNRFDGMVSASGGGLAGGFKDRGLMPEPRFGFAYDLKGNAKYVVRGGWGMSHDRFQGNPIYNLAVGDLNGVDPTFNGGTLANMPSLAASAPEAPFGVYAFDKSGKVPTIYSYSLGTQADIGWKTVLDIAYVGNQQRHLSQKHNLNAIPYDTAFMASAQDPSKYGNNNHVVTDESGWIGSAWTSQGFHYMGDNVFNQPFLEPYPSYQNIEDWTWDGTGNYNSLQVSAKRNFGSHLTFGAAYTFSKTLVTSSSDGAWTNILPNGAKRFNYTLASFDRPQNFTVNYVLTMPKFSQMMGTSNKFVSYLTDGWQWSGVGQFIKGPPGTVGGGYTTPWGSSEQPTITGSWTEGPILRITGNPTKGNGGDKYSHLNPAAFAIPVIGTPTPQAQNYFRTGGTNSVDMSIFRNLPFGGNEGQYLQLRFEAFNVFNHPQFYGINTGTGNLNVNGDTNPWDHLYGSGNNWYAGSVIQPGNLRPTGTKGNLGGYFGEYNGSGNAREVQLAVKLYF